MRIVPHPLLGRDIIGMAEHVHAVSGDGNAARRRIVEARELLGYVQDNPDLGTPLAGELAGGRVRHGGSHRQISVVYRYDANTDCLYLALVAFDWTGWGVQRTAGTLPAAFASSRVTASACLPAL